MTVKPTFLSILKILSITVLPIVAVSVNVSNSDDQLVPAAEYAPVLLLIVRVKLFWVFVVEPPEELPPLIPKTTPLVFSVAPSNTLNSPFVPK